MFPRDCTISLMLIRYGSELSPKKQSIYYLYRNSKYCHVPRVASVNKFKGVVPINRVTVENP